MHTSKSPERLTCLGYRFVMLPELVYHAAARDALNAANPFDR